ncbi:MAG: GNAT family N-acetyltransferase [Candidatus Latescibacterota bacterium]|jgi:ribosomal protein S18 acetylase RimI-like enzyme
MSITIRQIFETDTETCADSMYIAFTTVDQKHGFPSYFTDRNHATHATQSLITNPHIYGIVATENNRVIASAFMNEKRPIRSIGPVSVHPHFQGHGIGRKLMEHLLKRAQDAPSIRLTQDAFNTTSLSLYTSLGFALVESLVWIEGKFKNKPHNNAQIVALDTSNYNDCLALCNQVLGFYRGPDTFTDVWGIFRNNQLTAYTTGLSADGYTLAQTEDDLRTLILGLATQQLDTLSFLLPTHHTTFLLWCLSSGLKIKKPLNLMAKGNYQPPNGLYFPNLLC